MRSRAVAAMMATILLPLLAQVGKGAAKAFSQPSSRVVVVPPTPRIDGKPIFGSFNVWSLEDLHHVQDLGMNLIHDYHHEIQMQQLDPRSPMGRALYERGTKVLFNLLHHVRRGNVFGCDVEAATKDILAARGSPNLWGYWVLDDMEGDEKQAAKDLYQLVKQLDPRHTVVAGFGGTDSLVNFDKGMCDLVAFYPYPIFAGRYHRRYVSHTLEVGLRVLHERSPGMPFIGLVQTFVQPMNEYGARVKPTPRQVREQAQDYLRAGAVGLMNYGWRVYEGKSASSYPDLASELGRIGSDLATGKFRVSELPPPEAPAVPGLDQWQADCESPTGFGSHDRPAIGQQFVPSTGSIEQVRIMPHRESHGDGPVRLQLCEADPRGLPQETSPPIAEATIPAKVWRAHADRELTVPLSARLTPGRRYVIVLSCPFQTSDFQRFVWSSFSGLDRLSYPKGHLVERSGSPLRWQDFWDRPRSLYFATRTG